MDLTAAMDWASQHSQAVLITLRKDGRAQSSDVTYDVVGETMRISVTSDRAKTANMRRDPRVVLHLTDPQSWSYLSFDGTVELMETTTSRDDETNDALVEYFESVRGEPHPDWEEYRNAMIDEGRLLVLFSPESVVGQIH